MARKISHSFGPEIDNNPNIVGLEHTCSECGDWVIASAHHCVFCGARFNDTNEPYKTKGDALCEDIEAE